MWLSKYDTVVPWLVLTVGLTVCIGWMAEIPLILSGYGSAVTMKFMTAAMFVLVAVAQLCGQHRRFEMLGLSCVGAVMFLSMLSIIGFDGEMMPYAMRDVAFETVAAGWPSLGALVSFFTLGLFGLVKTTSIGIDFRYPGYFVMALGIIGVLGHVFDVPLMRFYLEDASSGMAAHTAALFIICGERFARYKVNADPPL